MAGAGGPNASSERAHSLVHQTHPDPSILTFAYHLPNQGWAPLTVYVSAFGSRDLDGDIVRYEWDLDGNGSFETDASATQGYTQYTYAKPGVYTITLQVTDDEGGTAIDSVLVSVRHPASSRVDYWTLFDDTHVQRIKLLVPAIHKHQPLTQAAFVEALLQFISGDFLSAMRDRDKILRGIKLTRATEQEEKRLIFKNMFIDERDVEIAEVVWNYFSAVEQRWPTSWAGVDVPGNMLPRTNGFRALMRFMRQVYLHLGGPGIVPEAQTFYQVFDKIKLKDERFTTKRYPPGTSGETGLYRDLVAESGLEELR